MPGITDRDAARALTGGRCVLTALGLVAALAGPWPGAVSRAEAEAPDSLRVLDGRVVRHVDIVSHSIFDPPPVHGGGLYTFANRLHVCTRQSTVRGALVFREGSPWSEARRVESERHLRSMEFLVPDTVVAVPVGDDSVDVRVVTHDNWTTSPEFGIESGGGQRYGSFSFIERNLLGLGTSLGLGYRTDVTGISRTASIDDNELLGSHWHGRVAASQGTSGRDEDATLLLPFWADDAPRALGGDWQRADVSADLFSGGLLAAHVAGKYERATRSCVVTIVATDSTTASSSGSWPPSSRTIARLARPPWTRARRRRSPARRRSCASTASRASCGSGALATSCGTVSRSWTTPRTSMSEAR